MMGGLQKNGNNTLKIDIVTLKVGLGYKSEYVNQLFKQAEETNDLGSFTCFTDNPRGINPNISIEEFNPMYKERMWWNKIAFFEPGLFKNDTIYLDLDCVIQGDLSPFVNTGHVLHTSWFSENVNHYIFGCSVNSSVMYLKDDNFAEVYSDFIEHKDKVYKSFYGLDSWMYRRHINKIKYFPEGLVYSFRYGAKYPHDVEGQKLRDNFSVCCFDDIEDKESRLKEVWNV